MTDPPKDAPETHPLFQKVERVRRRRGKVRGDVVTLAHGGGGKAMRDLIDDVFVASFDNAELAKLDDQARLALDDIAPDGGQLAFTTDSYVVDPIFFPGGDIGMLAINGTVNDLAVGGARPICLSSAVIIEEGFAIADLRRIAASMKAAADRAGVQIVTGDTKVVHRGAADKIFITTSGVGVIPTGRNLSASNARPGDLVVVSGVFGDHGVAILTARGQLALDIDIESDCLALNGLTETMLEACPDVRCMRDITRGGLAAILNEFAQASDTGMEIDETALPLRREVIGACELLGLDPLYLASEGALAAVIPAADEQRVLDAMRNDPAGRGACVIGQVVPTPPGIVVLNTEFGGQRLVDLLVGEQLPRIC